MRHRAKHFFSSDIASETRPPHQEGGTILRFDLPRNNEVLSISSRGVHYIAERLPNGRAMVVMHENFDALIPKLIAVSERAAREGFAPIG